MTVEQSGVGSIREQVTIMVVTTAIEFACGFALIGLAILAIIDMADGSISMRQLLAIPLGLGLAAITGCQAMMLICRPERRGMIRVGSLALVTSVPVVAAFL